MTSWLTCVQAAPRPRGPNGRFLPAAAVAAAAPVAAAVAPAPIAPTSMHRTCEALDQERLTRDRRRILVP